MSSLFEYKFSRNGVNYRVDLSFDDGAIMDGSAKFDTTISTQKEGDETWRDIIVTAELNWSEKTLTLTAKEGSLDLKFSHTIDLKSLLPEVGSAIDKFNDDYLDGFLDSKVMDGVEALVHSVPSDPLFGCLIKGSLSTLLGQIIDCWPRIRDESRHINTRIGKIRQMCGMLASCLKQHSLKMLGTFSRRFLKCAIFHGFA